MLTNTKIKTFGDLDACSVIYKVDPNSGYTIPYYVVRKIIPRENGRVSFECSYYDSKYGGARYSGDILFPKDFPYYIDGNTIYISDECLSQLCSTIVSLKVQNMAEKFNDLFGGLFKTENL